MGKQISSSQTSRVRRRSPDPSAPKTKATRSVKGNSVIELSDSPANPKHEILKGNYLLHEILLTFGNLLKFPKVELNHLKELGQ